MSACSAAILETRGVLALTGEDRAPFLQGLVTNDVARVASDRAIHAALLTPQGKFLFDLFVAAQGDGWLIDGEAARLADLQARLRKFKLRSKIGLTLAEGWSVAAAWGDGAAEAFGLRPGEAGAARALGTPDDGVAYVDPRLPAAGVRLILPADHAGALLEARGAALVDPAAYDRHRLEHGLPDGSRDLIAEKTTALEGGLEDLNGVDFHKGCYMGQELTARTKYRGLLKRRLMPVSVDGAVPEPGTMLLTDSGKDAGEMRSGMALDGGTGLGLAIVRLEALRAGTALHAGASRVMPRRPAWMSLPEPEPEPTAAG
ncbi:YgfZ/GcvT domain-containing protein [Roseospira navarrensis]|uniref:Folate-binding protein n=1 Tax=Roseospira navarrensis TaxID=140058 RepID=A0A7X2D2W7_9PROT|nr:folate-binding protein YgfZ [Roseospira navarrensis]MQX36699.1 folate-binding protein [Roseospira navarrensis]